MILTLQIEKPAAGGRMLARHEGQVVLVDGAIPGERVSARIERTGKGVAFAETIEVLSASPDRRAPVTDRRCGGDLFAHINYPRQLQLKAEIIADAFARIGRMRLPDVPVVTGSLEVGYRTRARLHGRRGRLGFFREGTHDLCDATATGQLLPQANAWIAAAESTLRRNGLAGLAGVEMAENVAGDERVCHLELEAGVDPSGFTALADGLTGLSAQCADRHDVFVLAGSPTVTDVLYPRVDEAASALRLRRNVRAFFQSNRFLLEPLVRSVVSSADTGPVIDLYAGVGLFGLSVAAARADHVTLVEGDPISSADLRDNAEAFGRRVLVKRASVEAFLGSTQVASGSGGARQPIVIADPPRTGLSKEALAGIVRLNPARLIYVSCDVATLARDARALGDGGYTLQRLSGFDLFPNTAHVETVAVFDRS